MDYIRTPGPWRASEGHDGLIVNYVVDESLHGSGVATICKVIDHDGAGRGDAELIAAAPNLLESCKEMYAALIAYQLTTDESPPFKRLQMVQRAAYAIQKAEEGWTEAAERSISYGAEGE